MTLRDDYGSPEVVAFVREQLAGFDLSKVQEFRLYRSLTKQPMAGYCQYPLKKSKRTMYRLTAGVNLVRSYPWTFAAPVGTKQHAGGRAWSYVLEHVTFATPEEVLVYVAGHEAFHFLRHSRQVSGRNGEPSATRYGLEWLARWRQCMPDRGRTG